MRACFQHHDRVGYLFVGSRRHIISDMVSNKRRAFYNMDKRKISFEDISPIMNRMLGGQSAVYVTIWNFFKRGIRKEMKGVKSP